MVELMVSEPLLCLLCFILPVLFMLPVSLPIVLLMVLLLVEVFCANTAQTGRRERPMAAIIIFFIWGKFLI